MDSPSVVNLPALYSSDRLGERPVAIIAHGTAGKDSREYLRTGGGRGVSIHSLIRKDGIIYRMVPDARGANHAGATTSSFTLNGRTYTGGLVNRATLGFELENLQDGRDPYTEPQLLAMGRQIAEWRAQWGNLPVLRHGDLDPTRRRDPYQLSVEQMELWTLKAVATTPPVSLPSTSKWVLTSPLHPIHRSKSECPACSGRCIFGGRYRERRSSAGWVGVGV